VATTEQEPAGTDAPEVAFTRALNQDQKDIRDWVHGFAKDVMRPAAHEWDEREETPWPIIEEAAKIGLYSFEGLAQFFSDPTGLTLPIANEELFWGDAGIGMAIMGTSLAVASIFGQGTGEQIGEWIPRCFGTPGDLKVAAFCASEPNAGSDISNVRTTARFDEAAGEWVLNGQKAWATNGGIADVHVVIASVDPALGARGHAAFIVPLSEAEGIEQGSKVSKHGLRASHTADVHLDDCRVPGSCLLGGKEKLDERLARVREGKKGKSQAAMQTFEASRPTVGSQAVGIARAAYEYSLDYAKERQQFGRPIVENQAIAFTLANMKMEIDACRLLVWRASWMGKTGQRFENAEGSMSKLKSGETAVWVTERAMQILGGNGYTREFPVERMHRDAKIYDIFEGTAEIQRLVISRAISGHHIK
jgi:acyl-CoA dehydrogenase